MKIELKICCNLTTIETKLWSLGRVVLLTINLHIFYISSLHLIQRQSI